MFRGGKEEKVGLPGPRRMGCNLESHRFFLYCPSGMEGLQPKVSHVHTVRVGQVGKDGEQRSGVGTTLSIQLSLLRRSESGYFPYPLRTRRIYYRALQSCPVSCGCDLGSSLGPIWGWRTKKIPENNKDYPEKGAWRLCSPISLLFRWISKNQREELTGLKLHKTFQQRKTGTQVFCL